MNLRQSFLLMILIVTGLSACNLKSNSSVSDCNVPAITRKTGMESLEIVVMKDKAVQEKDWNKLYRAGVSMIYIAESEMSEETGYSWILMANKAGNDCAKNYVSARPDYNWGKLDSLANQMLSEANKNSTAICGNGVLETGEGCDDGDLVSGDGCSSICEFEFDKFK